MTRISEKVSCQDAKKNMFNHEGREEKKELYF